MNPDLGRVLARKQSKVARDYRLDGNVGSKWYYEVPSHVREMARTYGQTLRNVGNL